MTFGKRGIVGRVLIGDISNSGPSVHVTTIVEFIVNLTTSSSCAGSVLYLTNKI